MKPIALFGSFALLLAGCATPTTIDLVIAREMRKAEAKVEQKDLRQHSMTDLDGDGIADDVVLFVLYGAHGGHRSDDFLAVRSSHSGRWTSFLVGAQGDRWVRSFESVPGGLRFSTLEYGPDDPSRSPSIESSVTFIWSHDELREVQP